MKKRCCVREVCDDFPGQFEFEWYIIFSFFGENMTTCSSFPHISVQQMVLVFLQMNEKKQQNKVVVFFVCFLLFFLLLLFVDFFLFTEKNAARQVLIWYSWGLKINTPRYELKGPILVLFITVWV